MHEYDIGSISGLFANKLLGNDNQHVTMITVGSTGKGKSWSNLEIAYQLGLKFAEQCGGDWTDYFNYETNIVIADLKEALGAIKRMKDPYQITIFDDIGVGWNSREWNSVGNKALNSILQVFRTKKNVLLITLPDQFLIDKVPRRLIHFYMEMEMSIHEHGISIGKFFRVISKPRDARLFHTYLRSGKRELSKHKFTNNLPADLINWYEPRRDQATDMIMEEQIKAVMDWEEAKANKKTGSMEINRKDYVVDLVTRLHEDEGMTVEDACKQAKITKPTYYKWKKEREVYAT